VSVPLDCQSQLKPFNLHVAHQAPSPPVEALPINSGSHTRCRASALRA